MNIWDFLDITNWSAEGGRAEVGDTRCLFFFSPPHFLLLFPDSLRLPTCKCAGFSNYVYLVIPTYIVWPLACDTKRHSFETILEIKVHQESVFGNSNAAPWKDILQGSHLKHCTFQNLLVSACFDFPKKRAKTADPCLAKTIWAKMLLALLSRKQSESFSSTPHPKKTLSDEKRAFLLCLLLSRKKSRKRKQSREKERMTTPFSRAIFSQIIREKNLEKKRGVIRMEKFFYRETDRRLLLKEKDGGFFSFSRAVCMPSSPSNKKLRNISW